MNLQTKISIKKEANNFISYNSKILLLGSCFSENIGNKLAFYKFQSTQNPFGILFHPKAIETLITNSINEKEYTNSDIFFHNERWHSFDAHSKVSNSDKENLLNSLNKSAKLTKKNIKEASHIIITLGTSWTYRFIETDQVVANCHKVPQKKFLKEILSIEEVTETLEAVIALIKSENPKTTILFTISPVRHLKDGFIENQQSKSHLFSAIHQVVNPRESLFYFPSYEIMMDELRDYRFYAEDMVHPNQTAIKYIWNKFSDTWISEGSKNTMSEVDKIQSGLNNKPFNATSDQHLKFKENLNSKIKEIQSKYSFINF